MDTARLERGRITIPGHLRAARRWREGELFELVQTEEGILIRPQNPFPKTHVDAVAGCLAEDEETIPIERLSIEGIDYREAYPNEGD